VKVTHVIFLEEQPGRAPFAGAENHLFTLMEGQVRAGMDVELAPLVTGGGPSLAARFAELERDGVRVVPQAVGARPFTRRRNLRLVLSLTPFFRSRRDRVIHTHLDEADTVGRVSAWLAGCRRLVSSNHNNEPYYATRHWRLKLRLLDKLNRHTIAISDVVRDTLVGTVGLPERKVSTIHYGVREPATVRSRPDVRRELGVSEGAYVVGFVGRLEIQKDLGVLFDAVRDLPSVQVVVVGAGSLDAALREHARANPAGQIRFIGYRPDAAELMPAFDVLCLPSRWEGLGLVLLEAMVRAVPVIGSDAGAIGEILDGGRLGKLFPRGDATALRAVIEESQASPADMRRLAEDARAHTLRMHTVEAMVRRTAEVYRSLADR
jgi:glycosyltransferase involved in cell wall biosynthesis